MRLFFVSDARGTDPAPDCSVPRMVRLRRICQGMTGMHVRVRAEPAADDGLAGRTSRYAAAMSRLTLPTAAIAC